MSGSDPGTGTFHQTQVTAGDTTCSVKGVLYVDTVSYYVFGSVNTARGHGGRVVTLSPPTSGAGIRFLTRPQVGKLVVACRWSAVYSTEP